MAEYKALYKCRLCGEVFQISATTGEKLAERCMVELNVGLVCTVPTAPTMTWTHNCGGDHAGSLGMADFLGWKKEGQENGTP